MQMQWKAGRVDASSTSGPGAFQYGWKSRGHGHEMGSWYEIGWCWAGRHARKRGHSSSRSVLSRWVQQEAIRGERRREQRPSESTPTAPEAAGHCEDTGAGLRLRMHRCCTCTCTCVHTHMCVYAWPVGPAPPASLGCASRARAPVSVCAQRRRFLAKGTPAVSPRARGCPPSAAWGPSQQHTPPTDAPTTTHPISIKPPPFPSPRTRPRRPRFRCHTLPCPRAPRDRFPPSLWLLFRSRLVARAPQTPSSGTGG